MSNDKDLDAAGLSSTSTVEDMLDNAEDPRQAIAEFQEQNSLLLPSLKPVLKILELHGVRRKEYNDLVLNKLSDKLMAKIKELGLSKSAEDIKKLEIHLDRSFKLYHVPKIRVLVLETLSRLPKLSNKILKKIIEDNQFYEECGISVKQQIWLIKDELFARAVNPILESYIDEKEKMLTAQRSSTSFFTCDTTKSRRQWNQIKELIVMIGSHEKLYEKLLKILRDKFAETESFHYCSFRLELLMAIHDLNVDYAIKIDPAHDISWCLDACVRDKHMDVQQTAKLKALLDKKKLTDENTADISFVLADSHTVHFLCSTTVKILCDNARSGTELPRENAVLPILLRLLYLADSTLSYINGELVDQKVEINGCLTRFLPLLTQFIAKDLFRIELLKRQHEDVVEEVSSNYEVQVPSENLVNFVKSDSVCSILWFHYTLQLLSKRNAAHSKELFENCLRVVCKSKNKILMKEPWASLLTHYLSHSPLTEQNINDERFSKVTLHDYYIRGINHNTNNKFHLLHLCSFLMSSISSDDLISKVLKAMNHNVAFFGLSSAKRFEKEFQQFNSAIESKNAVETSNEIHPIYVPIDNQPNDLLSSMQFDD